MTASNFPNVLPVTLVYEGGKSMDRHDPGNWTGGKVGKGVLKGTNMGIAANAHPTLDIMNLTKDEVSQIYDREYWVPSTANMQPNGLDLMVFDAAVNSGVGKGRAWLSTAKSRSKDTIGQVHAYASARLGYLGGLGTFGRYGKGWTARVANCEAKAVRMAAGPAQAAHVLTAAAAKQAALKVEKTKAAGSVTATGTAVSAATTAAPVAHHTALVVTLVALTVIAAVIGGVMAWQHSVRAKALAAEAAK